MSDRNSFELAKKLDFDSENEKEKSEVQNKVSNLMQRSWSSAGFTAARTEHRLETRSKSAQKLHQFDYNEIYKRKREERARQMEEEIKAQANSFKSRPMPNFREKKETNFPLRITVPITPEVLKRSKPKESLARRKQKFSEWQSKLEMEYEGNESSDKKKMAAFLDSKENIKIEPDANENIKMEPDSTSEIDVSHFET